MLYAILLAVSINSPTICSVQLHYTTPLGTSHGSGTCISNKYGQSIFLTNAHVVPSPEGRFSITLFGKDYKAYYLHTDCRADLSAVLVDGLVWPPARIADVQPPKGSRCYQAGYPHLIRTYKEGKVGEIDGYVTTINEHRILPAYWATWRNGIQSEPGDSGCAVYDDHGRLFNVVWGKPRGNGPTGGTGNEACIGLSDIKRFINTLP